MIKLHFLFISRGEFASIKSQYKSLKCFLYPPLPSVLTPCLFPKILIKLVFRSLGTRVKNNKFYEGDCTAHVQELTVVHDVEHMSTRSSSPSLVLTTEQKRERTWERGWDI